MTIIFATDTRSHHFQPRSDPATAVSPAVLASLDHDIAPDLHLWLVALDDYADRYGVQGLPAVDYEDASRLDLPEESRRLLARRHALRRLLGEVTGCAPAAVSICRDRRGRPRLQGVDLDFNMGASGGTALIGVRASGRVGVDVEVLRAVPEPEGLVRDHWTTEEAETWRAADIAERGRVLLSCWTRKEAVAKALGLGVVMSFRETHVGSSGALTVQAGPRMARGALTVCSLDLPGPLVGAVALTGAPEC